MNIAVNKIDISHVGYRFARAVLAAIVWHRKIHLVAVCDVTKQSNNDVTEGRLTNTIFPQYDKKKSKINM